MNAERGAWMGEEEDKWNEFSDDHLNLSEQVDQDTPEVDLMPLRNMSLGPLENNTGASKARDPQIFDRGRRDMQNWAGDEGRIVPDEDDECHHGQSVQRFDTPPLPLSKPTNGQDWDSDKRWFESQGNLGRQDSKSSTPLFERLTQWRPCAPPFHTPYQTFHDGMSSGPDPSSGPHLYKKLPKGISRISQPDIQRELLDLNERANQMARILAREKRSLLEEPPLDVSPDDIRQNGRTRISMPPIAPYSWNEDDKSGVVAGNRSHATYPRSAPISSRKGDQESEKNMILYTDEGVTGGPYTAVGTSGQRAAALASWPHENGSLTSASGLDDYRIQTGPEPPGRMDLRGGHSERGVFNPSRIAPRQTIQQTPGHISHSSRGSGFGSGIMNPADGVWLAEVPETFMEDRGNAVVPLGLQEVPLFPLYTPRGVREGSGCSKFEYKRRDQIAEEGLMGMVTENLQLLRSSTYGKRKSRVLSSCDPLPDLKPAWQCSTPEDIEEERFCNNYLRSRHSAGPDMDAQYGQEPEVRKVFARSFPAFSPAEYAARESVIRRPPVRPDKGLRPAGVWDRASSPLQLKALGEALFPMSPPKRAAPPPSSQTISSSAARNAGGFADMFKKMQQSSQARPASHSQLSEGLSLQGRSDVCQDLMQGQYTRGSMAPNLFGEYGEPRRKRFLGSGVTPIPSGSWATVTQDYTCLPGGGDGAGTSIRGASCTSSGTASAWPLGSLSRVVPGSCTAPPKRGTWKALSGIGMHSFLGLDLHRNAFFFGRDVRIEQLDSQLLLSEQPDCFGEVEAYAARLAQLRHPVLISCLGVESSGDHSVLFFEHTPPAPPSSQLPALGPMPEVALACCLRQVLEGLLCMHRRGLFHGGLCAGSVIMTAAGSVLLLDYALPGVFAAKAVNWMPPEELCNEELSSAVDVWGVGCLAVQMAIGRPPWTECRDKEQVTACITNGNACPRYSNDMSPYFTNFVEACLKRVPSERPTASALLKHPFLGEGVRLKEADIRAGLT